MAHFLKQSHWFSATNTNVLSCSSIGQNSDTGLIRLKSRHQHHGPFCKLCIASVSLSFPASWGCPHSLACGPLLHQFTASKGESSCSHVTSLWPPPLPPPACQNLCDYIDRSALTQRRIWFQGILSSRANHVTSQWEKRPAIVNLWKSEVGLGFWLHGGFSINQRWAQVWG